MKTLEDLKAFQEYSNKLIKDFKSRMITKDELVEKLSFTQIQLGVKK